MKSPLFVLPLLLLTVAACGPWAPKVASTVPESDDDAAAINLPISATFDRAMDPLTLTATTFLLKQGETAVAGTVTYAGETATFTPTVALSNGTKYTATVTVGAMDPEHMAMGGDHTWRFTTVAADAAPSISKTVPAKDAEGVSFRQPVMATFNMPMDVATLTTADFTLKQGATPVGGAVTYVASTNTAMFTPTLPYGPSLEYTATISTVAKSASGKTLLNDRVWKFKTRALSTDLLPVDLKSAGNYVILAKSQVSTAPPSVITGDVAVSPAAATFLTGFSLIADGTNAFSTSTQVTGKLYAADYAVPTPGTLTTAIGDMQLAFTDAAGRAADVTELGAGDIGGMTLAPGVYSWSSGLLIPTNLTLAGSATDIWIFSVAQNLTVSNGTQVALSGGALAKNVFWQVAGSTRIGTTSHVEGVILCQTMITLETGASVNGRLLAQTAVVLDQATVTQPAP